MLGLLHYLSRGALCSKMNPGSRARGQYDIDQFCLASNINRYRIPTDLTVAGNHHFSGQHTLKLQRLLLPILANGPSIPFLTGNKHGIVHVILPNPGDKTPPANFWQLKQDQQ